MATHRQVDRTSKDRGPGASARGRRRRDAASAPAVTASVGRRPACRVKARDAGGRIRAAAESSDVIEVRSRLRTLARQVRRRPQDVRQLTRIETEIADCVAEAATRPAGRERWLLDESAAWAVAWLTGSKRAGASAGCLLERILTEAAEATDRLAAGDSAPARFVLVLARLFADVEACRRLEEKVSAVLSAEIGRLVAASGAVALAGSVDILLRVNAWTECREVAVATGSPPWDEPTERLWAAAVGTSLRLLGARGRILAGSGQLPAIASTAILATVATSGGRRRPGHRFAKRVRRAARALSQPRRRRASGALPAADFQDASAGLTIIRSGWALEPRGGGLRVLLDHREPTPWLEIALGGRLLVAGRWRFDVRVGGRACEPQGPWTVEAWEPGRRVSFVEISAPLGPGIRLDRHLAVLPREGIVLAADAVVARGLEPADGRALPHLGNGAARSDAIDYLGTIPLAAAVGAEPAAETRELVIYDSATRGMALPLALPEWRTGGGGRFEFDDGLALAQIGHGRLYAPVWIDLDPRRVGAPLTWRQLTVADTRLILPACQAVGLRVQAGDEHWLVYRALDAVRNRTVLGCNMACDFLLGRIRPGGLVARTLEIA